MKYLQHPQSPPFCLQCVSCVNLQLLKTGHERKGSFLVEQGDNTSKMYILIKKKCFLPL